MNSENMGENIINAFEIVVKTYENCEKFLDALRNDERIKKNYILHTTDFLRYISGKYKEGWCIRSFALIYQKKGSGEMLENDYLDAPFYAIEINFENENVYGVEKIPRVFISKLMYNKDDILKWGRWGVSEIGCIYGPIHDRNNEDETEQCKNEYVIKKFNQNNDSKKYASLKEIKYKYIPLCKINAENFYEEIFEKTIEKM